ncbi:MAG: hypothetical protein KYX66_05310 [Blastomonas fulva]|uniref:hypothetical protein n=1 Tax=Blastomonas fulva TaxID=1550728 RepID=UPI0024E2438D|nr:hypothetical protein [Blastomonas fulva]MDK2756136.1 hypothetical protein [Blastomonas fulva]
MRWLERLGFLVAGAVISAVILLALGKIEMAGDFAANVAGATIGGMISILLAVMMFAHERRVAARDAAALAASQREQAIQEALRYVRAIRDCVIGAKAITINNCDRITTSLKDASALAKRALDDVNLTDFPLRLAMADAARIGHQTAESLAQQVQSSGALDADIHIAGTDGTIDQAEVRLTQLIDDYSRLRMLPMV